MIVKQNYKASSYQTEPKDFCKLVHILNGLWRMGIDNRHATGLCAVAFWVLYPQRGTCGKRNEWGGEILEKKQLKCVIYTRVSNSSDVGWRMLKPMPSVTSCSMRHTWVTWLALPGKVFFLDGEAFPGKKHSARGRKLSRMSNDIQDGKDVSMCCLLLSRFAKCGGCSELWYQVDWCRICWLRDGTTAPRMQESLMISGKRSAVRNHGSNIRTQTMAVRRETKGSWGQNGMADLQPYGYKLWIMRNLLRREDEAEVNLE